MSLKKAKDQKVVLAESLLACISEVMSSVTSVEIEQQTFMEIGCYLHRTSPVIMELWTIENAPPCAPEVIHSLSTKVNLAKDLVARCSSGAKSIKDDELKFTIEQLEEVIRKVGQDLSSIPLSTFENRKYAEMTVRSLSREMKNVSFHINGTGNRDADENKLVNPSMAQMEKREGTDPVPSSDELYILHSSWSGNMPRLGDFLNGMHYDTLRYASGSLETLSQSEEYSEPLYDTFFCPLTKKIMKDPVTIESGITFERKAIGEWFSRFKDVSEIITCPITGMKLQTRVLNSNIALKTTIAEWKRRNEAKRIKVAHNALLLATSKAMVLDAVRDLRILSQRSRYNKEQMHQLGITNLVTCFLEHDDMMVRTEAAKLLCLLVEDEEGKVIIADTKALESTTAMLTSNNSSEMHVSVAFLLKLSESEILLESIGSTTGCILMLITIKYNESADSFAAEKARKVLKNLEKYPKNIKSMAEYGLLEPLLDHLVAGSEEVQLEMARYLSKLILEHDKKIYVAGKASKVLINMITSGHILTQRAAFGALVQISSHHLSSKMLVDAGIVPVLMEETFTHGIYNKSTDFKEEAAVILANIVKSKTELDRIQVNKHGHTITSRYSIYNIAHMLKHSKSDKLNINLIKILLSMAELPNTIPAVVSVIKETEASYMLIEFLNSPVEKLTIAAAKLLISLSSQLGHTVAQGLCKTQGQPGGLVKNCDVDQITKKHATLVDLLVKLPHQNLTLNLALLHQGSVPTILSRMQQILGGETRATRYTRRYLEGLVGVLVRFTATLYDQEILHMAREQNLTKVLTELLVRTAGSNEVQRLAAVGLENLSSQSVHLSRPPDMKIPSRRSFLSKSFILSSKEARRRQRTQLCPVHRGACSSSTTFCLLESRAVERLLSCLEHENPEVVEAALSAISTLLDKRVDVEKSVRVLGEADALRHVLGVLRQHREEGLWQKSFWVIERFLMSGGDDSVSDLSNDRLLPSALVTAVHKGSSSTKKLAENILRYLNRMPHLSSPMVI